MIRPGMKIAEAILQLTKGFRKMMGRDPDGLEKIKIQQEAVKRIEEVNKVVDMKGNVIDTSKGIMGGRQIQDSPEFGKKIKETYDKAKGPGKGQEMVDALKSPGAKKTKDIIEDQLGMKLYGDETFEEILEIQKTGKHPRGEPKAEGGRIGYKDGMLKKGLKSVTGSDTYKTLENRGFNAAVLMSEGFDQVFNLLSSMPFAEGGRIGYKDGPDKPGRRKFIKTAVGIATLIPGLGKGIKLAKPAVEKAVELSGPALAKIVETVMSAGKLISVQGKRVKEMVTKKKLKDVEVEEDIMDQSYTIKKGGKEIYYKPGRMDETGGIEDDIIEVIDKTIKKASGGVARMLGE
jgi:hypothetical protein